MSLKFNEAITIVAEKLFETPKPKYQTYKQDAAEISAKMDQELIKINSIFKGTVTNWDETTDFYKSEPKLHIPLLRVEMPFTVEPQRVFVFSTNELQAVNLKTSVNHPAVENGYLNGEKLTKLFIWDLNTVIDRISKITCSSGKIYKLGFEVDTHKDGSIFIVIKAMENDSQYVPSICFAFLTTFIFKNKSLYYTYALNFFHQSEESVAASEIRQKAKVVHNVKILLHTLLTQSSKQSPSDLLMILNSVIINPGIKIEIGDLLFEAIPSCIPRLQNPGPLIISYGKLLQFKQSDSVQLSELKEIFGLK